MTVIAVRQKPLERFWGNGNLALWTAVITRKEE